MRHLRWHLRWHLRRHRMRHLRWHLRWHLRRHWMRHDVHGHLARAEILRGRAIWCVRSAQGAIGIRRVHSDARNDRRAEGGAQTGPHERAAVASALRTRGYYLGCLIESSDFLERAGTKATVEGGRGHDEFSSIRVRQSPFILHGRRSPVALRVALADAVIGFLNACDEGPSRADRSRGAACMRTTDPKHEVPVMQCQTRPDEMPGIWLRCALFFVVPSQIGGQPRRLAQHAQQGCSAVQRAIMTTAPEAGSEPFRPRD
jgi:hypothetical protein